MPLAASGRRHGTGRQGLCRGQSSDHGCARGRRTEGGGQRAEDRGRRTEDRGQRTDHGQRTTDHGPACTDHRSLATDHWAKAVCRAGAVVLLVGFWFDGGLFKLATAAPFWILLELGRDE